MIDRKRNIGASVTARLLNRAKQAGDNYQNLLTAFCFERFLFRLGVSVLSDRFVLKGAMLLGVWSDRPYRATRDLDLLRRGDGSWDAIRTDLGAICTTAVEPDGVSFDPEAIRIAAIRPEDEYAGTRATLPARCGTALLTLQIDMGLGDSVWPMPEVRPYPAMLEFPPPRVLVYPPEAVIAEKLEAIVILGDRNSRIKDFFDLDYLARHFEFDRPTLAEAIRRTFAQRRTPIPAEDPIGLTTDYWRNASRAPQVAAFARRAALTVDPEAGLELLRTLRPFLLPILNDVQRGVVVAGKWAPGGPWR